MTANWFNLRSVYVHSDYPLVIRHIGLFPDKITVCMLAAVARMELEWLEWSSGLKVWQS